MTSAPIFCLTTQNLHFKYLMLIEVVSVSVPESVGLVLMSSPDGQPGNAVQSPPKSSPTCSFCRWPVSEPGPRPSNKKTVALFPRHFPLTQKNMDLKIHEEKKNTHNQFYLMRCPATRHELAGRKLDFQFPASMQRQARVCGLVSGPPASLASLTPRSPGIMQLTHTASCTHQTGH